MPDLTLHLLLCAYAADELMHKWPSPLLNWLRKRGENMIWEITVSGVKFEFDEKSDVSLFLAGLAGVAEHTNIVMKRFAGPEERRLYEEWDKLPFEEQKVYGWHWLKFREARQHVAKVSGGTARGALPQDDVAEREAFRDGEYRDPVSGGGSDEEVPPPPVDAERTAAA